jgi:aryl-alcohol dehydrogenase-like predicted oxidoreductase
VSARRLALGTVQFGMPYGIANRRGQVPPAEAAVILESAWAAGMNTLQTAIDYGDSERTLGGIGVADWRVISKLPALPRGVDVPRWVRDSVQGSLSRLGVPRLHALLLHRSADLIEDRGALLYATLLELRAQGLVGTVGVSIYAPEELDGLIPAFEIGHVQTPFNVLDRRIARSGWLGRLTGLGVEVHARSLFLQGLLLLASRPPQFGRWLRTWRAWDEWLAESGLTPVQACIGFGTAHPELKRLLVGVENVAQLEEIIAAAKLGPIEPPSELATEDTDLISPVNWGSQ